MKRIMKLILLILIIFGFNVTSVFASTNTFERSEDNYLVPDGIEVSSSNKSNVLNTPAVDASEKIYDFADLFTDSEEEQLYSEVVNYIDIRNMDLAIVTIDYNNKISPQEYADDFYDYNDFGLEYSRDGVLFLIDMYNREIYMTTTGYAINMYDDYRINEALDSVYTYMSDEDYYEGVSNFIDILDNYAGEGLPSYDYSGSYEEKSILEVLGVSVVISLVVTAIIIGILIFKNRMVRKATTAREYLNKESVVVNNVGEIFVNSNTIKHKIEHNSSSGGSSTHSGSSGVSHGGGGRSF